MAHLNTKRFATYRNRLIRIFGLLTFLTVLTLGTLPMISLAQCPPNDPAPPGQDPWVGNWVGPYSKTIQLTGTNCYVTYIYCSREGSDPVFGFFWATFLESVTPVPGSDCSNLPPDQVIKLLYQQLETIGNGTTVGPCTNGTTYVVNIAPDCWEDVPFLWTDGKWYPAYQSCGTAGNCRANCQVCQNADGTYTTTCTYSGSDDGSCTPLPNPDQWQPNTCYDVAPCGTLK